MRGRTISIVVVLAFCLAASHLPRDAVAFSGFLHHRTIKSAHYSRISPMQSAANKEETVLTTKKTSTSKLNPREEGLALLLDNGTRKSHSVAENTAFVSGFFKGLSTKESYRNLITSLYFVYEAMEHSFDTTSEKRVKALDGPELRRLDALEQDLEYFYGTDWKSKVEMTPATKAYVARIKEISQDKPYLLVGHQYSRYLGDLFGGQMMGGMAIRSLGLSDGQGVMFYEFDQIPNTKDYVTRFYEKLNLLPFTDADKQEIVDEANFVFALNIAIFEELEGSPFKAMWTLTINSLKFKLGFN